MSRLRTTAGALGEDATTAGLYLQTEVAWSQSLPSGHFSDFSGAFVNGNQKLFEALGLWNMGGTGFSW